MARRAGPGRPHKGDRDSMITRPARPVGDVVRARADAAGLSISEYVAAVLAEAHGLPEYAPASRRAEVKPTGAAASAEIQEAAQQQPA